MGHSTFAKCPFCSKTFDISTADTVKLVIDQYYRYAHRECMPVAHAVVIGEINKVDKKPNGGPQM